ncbi:MAG: oxidoreductase [Acidimicrobiia bacterium]|nr:MAG: oxidoreductase [Acidimicrobiia bacterium]
MRALRVHELGEPADVLVPEDVPVPEPRPGQVRVRVAAASCNFPDVLMCRGGYQVKPPLPFTPGAEVAGFVDALGPGVEGLEVGQRVLAVPVAGLGGFAQYTCAPASATFPIPDAMGFAAASALHVTYQTGHLALHRRARLAAGETLLVHAGAGGVGSAAIQLGLAAGARVVATAGGPDKVEVCRRLGCEAVIDYRTEDFVEVVKELTGGRGADVIYDPVGGDVFDRSRRCVAFEGRILVIGFTGGRFADAPTNHVLIKNYSVVGLHWALYDRYRPDLVRRTHDELVRLHGEGLIDPLISRTVTLEQVPAALQELAGRGTWGKVVAQLPGAGA